MSKNEKGAEEGEGVHLEVAAIDKEIETLQHRIIQLKTRRASLASMSVKKFEQSSRKHNILDESKLTSREIYRYSRQLLLNDGWGVSGQLALKASKVLVIGSGGIGSSLLMYLAAAGVGTITIVDYDDVELSNIHRQIIHNESACISMTNNSHSGDQSEELSSMKIPKVFSAKNRLLCINSDIIVNARNVQLSFNNAMEIFGEYNYDVVVDASDNPHTRYIINDACVFSGKTLVSGSAIGTEGQLTIYNYKESGCYRCLYPINKSRVNSTDGCKSCSDNGVLGTVPGLIGILQATEVLKLMTGIGTTMQDKLLMYDSLQNSFLRLKKSPRNPKCDVCSEGATIKSMEASFDNLKQIRGPSSSEGINIDDRIPSENHISCIEFDLLRKNGVIHILLLT